METPEYFQRRNHPVALLLLPLSFLFRLFSAIRRLAYRLGLIQVHRFNFPVVVVGNITVGGSGKTPLVIWLCNHFRELGYRPGVVLRGYGGEADQWPRQVRADSDPTMVGDEAVVIARGSGCPVVASPDRSEAVESLLAQCDCDLVISDDGLQHYAMGRDIEIVVLDGERRLGNGYHLPAGPLREGRWRLRKADCVVVNGGDKLDGEYQMQQMPGKLINIRSGESLPLEAMVQRNVHAVAGLGNPERFFKMLEKAGIGIERVQYPDHHQYSKEEIDFDDALPVIMTEKDAVKCAAFASDNNWYLQLQVQPEAQFIQHVTQLVEESERGQKTA